MSNTELFRLTLLILHDRCPPDNTMYYCDMGEDPEHDCELCWLRYLYWAEQGCKGRNPYDRDRLTEAI